MFRGWRHFFRRISQSSGKTAIKKRSHTTNYSNVLRDDFITTEESRPKYIYLFVNMKRDNLVLDGN